MKKTYKKPAVEVAFFEAKQGLLTASFAKNDDTEIKDSNDIWSNRKEESPIWGSSVWDK